MLRSSIPLIMTHSEVDRFCVNVHDLGSDSPRVSTVSPSP